MILNLLQFGRVSYGEGLRLQKALIEARYENRIGNTLVLLEHPPVLTLGRNASRANILASDEFLASRGVEVHEVNRGGDVTYHGPGQLVGYPIFDLRSFTPRLGAVQYVRMMEEALIRACGDFGVQATRVAGRTGVWIPAGGSVLETEDRRDWDPHRARHHLAWFRAQREPGPPRLPADRALRHRRP